MTKRGLDILVSATGLLLAALPMALIGLALLIGMGRPVIFVQRRAGRGGVDFRLIKFRTMSGAVGADGALLPDADRITPIGAMLRRTRLDELPELWNVWRGDMSLVGPRPLLPTTIAGFGPAGQLRSTVRPGLTGLAQISGNTLLTDRQKLAIDLLYIQERSAMLDLMILLRTPLVMICGERLDRLLMEKADARSCGRSG